MQDKFNQFKDWVLSQGVEISDKSNIFQCMDLAYSWVFFLNLPKNTIQHLYAYEVFTKPNGKTFEHFDLIPNSSSFVPRAGDLVVFDKTASNIAGHIAIATGEGDTKSFKSLDQNWAGQSKSVVVIHNYDNPKVLGVLRAKTKESTAITDQTRIPQIENMEVHQIKSILIDRADTIASLKKEIESWKSLVGETSASLAQVRGRVLELEEEIIKIQKPLGPFARMGRELDLCLGLSGKDVNP